MISKIPFDCVAKHLLALVIFTRFSGDILKHYLRGLNHVVNRGCV